MKTEFETYRELGSYESSNLTQVEPSCFNGIVRVRRYKITCELVDEPDEVIRERICKLWKGNKNHHNWQPLLAIGKMYGIDLNKEPRE